VHLCDVEGYSYAEIADIMAVRKRAVRSFLHQGRTQLLSTPVLGSHLGGRLSTFLDGEPSIPARERVIAHLADCPACWDLADQLRNITHRLRTARPESAGGRAITP
jgi:sigma-70-like protein/putative zinc finger protein